MNFSLFNKKARQRITTKVAKSTIGVIMVLSILLLTLEFPIQTTAQTEYYEEHFEWTYDDADWTWNLSIRKSLYDSYKLAPVSTRNKDGPAGWSFLTTTNDTYLQQVAEKLQEAASEEGYEPYDEVSLVLAFVQSLPYTKDSVTSRYDEYPRFPLETLADNGGDCEDTAILFATIVRIMGYGAVYISLPDHYAVGVLGEDLPGYYWTYEEERYYYCETTGDGWKIGDLPTEYEDVEAYVYEITEEDQYVPVSEGNGQSDESENSSQSSDDSIPVFDFAAAVWAMIILLVVVVIVAIAVSVYSRRKRSQPFTQPPAPNSGFPEPPPPPPS